MLKSLAKRLESPWRFTPTLKSETNGRGEGGKRERWEDEEEGGWDGYEEGTIGDD
jgi:hypothetical protein